MRPRARPSTTSADQDHEREHHGHAGQDARDRRPICASWKMARPASACGPMLPASTPWLRTAERAKASTRSRGRRARPGATRNSGLQGPAASTPAHQARNPLPRAVSAERTSRWNDITDVASTRLPPKDLMPRRPDAPEGLARVNASSRTTTAVGGRTRGSENGVEERPSRPVAAASAVAATPRGRIIAVPNAATRRVKRHDRHSSCVGTTCGETMNPYFRRRAARGGDLVREGRRRGLQRPIDVHDGDRRAASRSAGDGRGRGVRW